MNADKQFTVQQAPLVLTIHLKRFSPMGRKIGHPVRYDEQISLQPCMSEGEFGPTYSLYGVISHAGGGPNSGHYYAHVKAANGQWFEMNDDSVMRHGSAPTSMKNAYILFYIREKGQALEAALNAPTSTPSRPPGKTGLVANMKKRKIIESDDEGDRPSPAKTPKRFIGPLLPTASPQPPAKDTPKTDPQAEALKKKIAAATSSPSAKGALLELAEYKDDDDDEDDDVGEKVEKDEKAVTPEDKQDSASSSTSPSQPAEASQSSPARPASPAPAASSLASSSSTEPPPPPSTSASSTSAPSASSSSFGPSGIPPSSFYGPSASKQKDKKRKTPDGDEEDATQSRWAKTRLSPPLKERRFSVAGVNPYSKLKGSNNLKQRRDSTGSPGVVRTGGNRKRHMIM